MKTRAVISAYIGAVACAYIAFDCIDRQVPWLYLAASFFCIVCCTALVRIHRGKTEDL